MTAQPECSCNAIAHAGMHRSDCERALWMLRRPNVAYIPTVASRAAMWAERDQETRAQIEQERHMALRELTRISESVAGGYR